MRNLFILLQRFRVLLLFLLLEGMGLVLTIQQFNFQRVLFFQATSGITGTVETGITDIKTYGTLGTEVELLRLENAALRSQLQESMYKVYGNKGWLADTLYTQIFQYLPGRVINNSTSGEKNYFTLDVGAMHGVKEDMGVISPEGAVGVIIAVSPHFSLGMSLLNTQASLAVQMKKTGDFGQMFWTGKSSWSAQVRNVPSHVEVAIGDTVETSGHSSIFPEGVPVGRVTDFEVNPDDGYYEIIIELFTNFNRVRHIYVVNHRLREEQNLLEAQTNP